MILGQMLLHRGSSKVSMMFWIVLKAASLHFCLLLGQVHQCLKTHKVSTEQSLLGFSHYASCCIVSLSPCFPDSFRRLAADFGLLGGRQRHLAHRWNQDRSHHPRYRFVILIPSSASSFSFSFSFSSSSSSYVCSSSSVEPSHRSGV